MLAEMLVRISERLLAGGSARVADAGADPAAQLRALIAFHVDFALDNPALITVQDRDLGSPARRRGRAGPPAAAPLRRGVGGRAAPGCTRPPTPPTCRAARARRLRADQLHPAQRRPARPRRRWPTCSPTWPGPPRRLTPRRVAIRRGTAGLRAPGRRRRALSMSAALARRRPARPTRSPRSSPSPPTPRWRTPHRTSSDGLPV